VTIPLEKQSRVWIIVMEGSIDALRRPVARQIAAACQMTAARP
jgi:hypothetical protein